MIDSHQHYWSVSRDDYGWLTTEQGILYRDYMPNDLRPELDRLGIRRTIAVQAAPTVEETHFLLGLSDADATIAGVVGWLDFESEGFEKQLNELQKHPKFVGVRPMIQDKPDDWILQRDVVANIRILERRQVPIDLQLRPRLMPAILELIRHVPKLYGVVDHLAKPDIWSGAWQPWAQQIEELAGYPHIMAKLSGMVPEKEGQLWTPEQIEPYAKHVIQAFGPKRIMFGSDWPVCLLSAQYEDVFRLVESLLPAEWNYEQRIDVFGRNAARFYNVGI
jgi:L-fuconolactonase